MKNCIKVISVCFLAVLLSPLSAMSQSVVNTYNGLFDGSIGELAVVDSAAVLGVGAYFDDNVKLVGLGGDGSATNLFGYEVDGIVYNPLHRVAAGKAYSDYEKPVRIVSLQGDLISEIPAQGQIVFSKDGSCLFGKGMMDYKIRAYDWRDGSVTDSLVRDGFINDMIPVDGARLLFRDGGENNALWLWEAGTGSAPSRIYSTANTVRKVVTADNFIVVVENLEEMDYYHRVRLSVISFKGEIITQWEEDEDVEQLVLSPNGNVLATTNRFDYLKLWRGEGGDFRPVEAMPDDIGANAMLFLDDQDYLILSDYYTLSFFSLADLAVVETLQLSGEETTFNGPLATIPSTGRFLAAIEHEEEGGGLMEIEFNGIQPQKELAADNSGRQPHAGFSKAAVVLQSGHLSDITGIVFGEDEVLFSGDKDGTLIKWDLKSGLHHEPIKLFGNDEVFGGTSGESPLELAYNPALGHLAVTADNNVALPVLDAETMEQLHSIPVNSLPSSPAYSQDGSLFAVYESLEDQIKIFMADSAGYELLYAVPVDASVNEISFFGEEPMLAVADVTGRIHIIDSRSGKETRLLEGHDGGVVDLGLSTDGKYLYSVDFNSNIFRWNLDTYEQETFYKSSYTDGNFMEAVDDSTLVMHLQVDKIAVGANGEYLYSIGDAPGTKEDGTAMYTIRRWDAETGETAGHFEAAVPPGLISVLDISGDGSTLVTGDLEGTLQLWDVASQRQYKAFEKPIAEIQDAIPYFDAELVLGVNTLGNDYRYGLQRWSVENLRIEQALDGGGFWTDDLVLDPENRRVGTESVMAHQWVSFDTVADSSNFRLEEYHGKMHAVPEGGLLFGYDVSSIEGEPDYSPLRNIAVHVYDTETQDKLYTIESEGMVSLSYENLIPRFHTGQDLFALQSGRSEVKLFNYTTGELQRIISSPHYVHSLSFGEQHLYLWRESDIAAVDLDTGQINTIIEPEHPVYDPETRLATASDGMLAWVAEEQQQVRVGRTASYLLQVYDTKERRLVSSRLPEVPQKLLFTDKGRMAVAVFRNYLSFYLTGDGELVGSMVPVGTDDYFFYTPDFYYSSSRNAYGAVGFQYRNQMISFDQLDLWYNRPDILMERWGVAGQTEVDLMYEAYTKRLAQAGFGPGSELDLTTLPEVQLVEDVPLRTGQKTVSLSARAVDRQHELSSLHLYANGVPVWGTQGKKIGGHRHEEQIEVELLPGMNKLQVSARNEQGFESLRETVEIEYRPDLPAEADKSDLYLISINVSDYLSDNDLQYARKDGKDLTSLYAQKQAEFYSEIHIDTLFDSDATLERITALKEKLQKTGPEDRVILFVSGHGLLDRDYEFYFATYDTDFSNPAERGISYDRIEWLLDGIPARRKLLLIDACHSGEVDRTITEGGDEATRKPLASNVTTTFEGAKGVGTISTGGVGLNNSFELMQELFANLNRGSGTVVISAAAGNSYALESDEWQNGVFTYALLDGLKNLHADADGNGEITVTELRNYVYRKVVEETGGRQKPTARQENLEFDFRVW